MVRMHGLCVMAVMSASGLACGVAAGQVLNDSCDTAQVITLGAVRGSTVGATTDAFPAACATPGPDVFYRWTAPATCRFEIATCDGSIGFDTVLAIYSGCPATPSNLIQCADDSCGLRSSITLNATRGQTYTFRVSGYNDRVGEFALTVRQLDRPVNDSCEFAGAIGGATGSVIADTTCALSDGVVSCLGGDANGNANLFYVWTAPFHGVVTFDTCGGATQFDTVLSASVTCPHDDASIFVCNDDSGCGQRSSITFAAVEGSRYYIRVSGYRGSTGQFTLNWTEGSNGGASPNDVCETAQPISFGTVTGTNRGASVSNQAGGCLSGQRDVYYRFVSPISGIVHIAPCEVDPNTPPVISVHGGCPATPLNRIVCGLSSCEDVKFAVLAGVSYYIRVASLGSSDDFAFIVRPEVEAVVFDPSTLGEYYLLNDGRDIGWMRFEASLLGGTMACINSFSENQFVANSVMRARNKNRSAAIGLSDESQEGVMLWDSGDPVEFRYFLAGQPDNFNGAEDYTHMFDSTGAWNDYPGAGAATLHGVAESDAEILARVVNPANGHLYVLFKSSSWEGARARARAMGGDLVTIDNVTENEFVRTQLAQFGGPGHRVWIGLNDASAEGNFVWSSGSTSSFRNFPSGFPNDRFGTEDYVAMDPGTGHWDDRVNLDIQAPTNGVAEIVLPPVVGAPVHGPTGCGTYVLVGPTNFYPAVFKAEELGGHLVSIGNASENEFIRATFAAPGNRRLWLGASDKVEDGKFAWTDGRVFDYSNFAAGEPNNFGPEANEDYLEMSNPATGEWNDASTTDALAAQHYAVIRIDCRCDWNGDGRLNSQDFFDFIGDFFADRGNFNCDESVNSQDFFDFLSCFFGGCD